MLRHFLLLALLATVLLFAPIANATPAQLTVLDSATAAPLAGAVVTEFASGRQFVTDAQGTILLPADAMGTISAAARGYLPVTASLEEGTHKIDGGSRVRVKLLPDGKVRVFDAARPATVTIWEPKHATAHISPQQELVLP